MFLITVVAAAAAAAAAAGGVVVAGGTDGCWGGWRKGEHKRVLGRIEERGTRTGAGTGILEGSWDDHRRKH